MSLGNKLLVSRRALGCRPVSAAIAMLKHIMAGVILALMLTGGAVAGPFEDGVAAYQRGDYTTALRLLRPLAEQGDADAQYNLGVLYVEGNGVPQDHAEAVRWFRKAADQRITKAQYNLGLMYDNGEGVPQDYAEAVKWYTYAALQGMAEAQYNLGFMLEMGQGTRQEYAQAVMWYRLAAEQGNAKAQLNLGHMYARGWGVPKDFVLAHMWSNLAASRFPVSDPERDKAVRNRDRIASNMTPEQLAEAQRRAREWKPK
jgi:hypothetical protein